MIGNNIFRRSLPALTLFYDVVSKVVFSRIIIIIIFKLYLKKKSKKVICSSRNLDGFVRRRLLMDTDRRSRRSEKSPDYIIQARIAFT